MQSLLPQRAALRNHPSHVFNENDGFGGTVTKQLAQLGIVHSFRSALNDIEDLGSPSLAGIDHVNVEPQHARQSRRYDRPQGRGPRTHPKSSSRTPATHERGIYYKRGSQLTFTLDDVEYLSLSARRPRPLLTSGSIPPRFLVRQELLDIAEQVPLDRTRKDDRRPRSRGPHDRRLPLRLDPSGSQHPSRCLLTWRER